MTENSHPPPEILGAFLEGTLAGTERLGVVEHLADCDRCVGFVRGAREAESETRPVAPPVPIGGSKRRPWLLAAAAVIVGVLAIAGPYLMRDRTSGVQTLIAAAPETYRTIEPRLTGFRWAELRRMRSGDAPKDSEALKLAGAAGEVLEKTRDDESANARRAAGVASLLVDDTDRAIEELQRAASREPKNAAAWNDLAAALYTSAAQQRRAANLPDALAAAERALVQDPSNAEARFNRALILERMGLQTEAAAAWREYLEVDGNSPWAEEARRRMNAIKPGPQARFRDRIAVLESAATNGDRARVDAILREFPQETRGWYEADVLGRWGETELRGDAPQSAKLLESGRTVAEALRSASGELLLADAVAAIDRAGGDTRQSLARAHAGYRAGRLAYRDRKFADAERMLLDAAKTFDAAKSPMSGVARTYAASVIFDQNRIAGAAALLAPIVANPDASHIALTAQASLFLGRCSNYARQWNSAVRHYTAARDGFARLKEPANLADAEASLGNVYASAGNVEKAWQHRLAALQIFGNDATHGGRLLGTLASIAHTEQRNERWAAAEAMLRLEIAEARRGGDALLIADAHKRRAALHAQLGNLAEADADLREARGYASKAPASGLRTRLEAECLLVEGTAARARDVNRSLAALTGAVEFARSSGDRRLLPEALLERARTHRAAGREDAAWSDLAAGIDDVEDRRATAQGGPGATFDSAGALFDEAIDLLLDRNEHERAFAYADRAEARALFDAMAPDARAAAKVADIAAALPDGAALVAYALLPDRVVLFRIGRDGLRVAEHPIARNALEAEIRALRTKIEAHGAIRDIRGVSARVDAALVAPLRALGSASSLVIAGNRVVQSVPWAALWDAERGEYLIERSSLSVAPSAAVWLANRARIAERNTGSRLLLVTSDTRPDLDALSDLRREREGLQAMYARHALLVDTEATPARFLEHAGAADVVHYGGHARAASDVDEAALLLANDSELRASDIAAAKLARPWLVVLAACNTMTSGTTGLEGAPDLARGFLAAGVPTVVGTLWRIDDAMAATLFVAFHRRVREGATAAAALRDAQLAMLRSGGRDAHPAAWAAAEILGGSQ